MFSMATSNQSKNNSSEKVISTLVDWFRIDHRGCAGNWVLGKKWAKIPIIF